jgi:RNA polymerase sigma-70 factor (ECF subfamily)
VLAYAYRRTGPEDAEEVVAETFLIAWRRTGDLPADPVPWLLRTARNVIANRYRADRRGGELRARLGSQRPAAVADPAERAAGDDAVRATMAALPEREREALALHVWDGLSNEQAAVVLGCSRTTFAVRLHRARTRLRKQLTVPVTPSTEVPS